MRERRNDGSGRLPVRLRVLAGPALFALVLVLPPPEGLGTAAHATLAVAGWMAVWWLSVAVPLAVTALLPLVLLPALGAASPTDAAAPYANPVIFLFMGGFFIAAAMQRWELHRRIALAVVARTGTSPRRLVGGFMLASAFMSMWMSNTAATLMMMPIGVAVLRVLAPSLGTGIRSEDRATEGAGGGSSGAGAIGGSLGTALMLGIAYAGSIGGVSTLIGTPPNAVLAGMSDELLGLELSFARWMAVGLPLAAILLGICWLILCFPLYHLSGAPLPAAARLIEEERRGLGAWAGGERVTGAIFALAAVAWIFRAPKEIGDFTLPGIQTLLPEIGDSTVAMAAALALFLWPTRTPSGERTTVLDWAHARSIPWDILILFGGGLSLAAAFESTGLTTWLGGRLIVLSGLPTPVIVGAVAGLFVLLTEITSNTATATLGLPVVAALAASVGAEPLPLMAAAALGASMAFMLPVATPPNAIVFGTGYIEASEMRRAGIWLNVLSILAVSVAITAAYGWLGA